MASNQPRCSLLGSLECFENYMKFLDEAVKTAKSKKVVLYIASGPYIHASTLSEVVSKVEEQENLSVIYYFRDKEFDKIISAANGESEANRVVEKGLDVEQKTLKKYFSKDQKHRVLLSYCGQDLYFHTKWAAFHPDSISDSDEVQILLTSANLTFDHLKCTRHHPDTNGSVIFNSMIWDTLTHTEFTTQFEMPMKSGPVLCRPVRFGTGHKGRLTQEQPPGNYNDVEVFSQVKHFVDEAVAYSKQLERGFPLRGVVGQGAKSGGLRLGLVVLDIVSPFLSDEFIIESILSQTREARTGNKLTVRIFSKSRPVGTDWETNVKRDTAKDFHFKYLAYWDENARNGDTVNVLMTSANLDTKHMSGYSKKKKPSYHNLDWTYQLQICAKEYKKNMTFRLDTAALEEEFGKHSLSD